MRATAVGARTSALQLGTGISYSFTRHPLALAAAAMDVHEATGGRFTLGLGTGTGGMRKRWYGIASERPAAMMREAVDLIRQSWAAENDFVFEGDFYSAHVRAHAQRHRTDALPPLRIMGAGLGAGMVAAAARHYDGVLLHPLAIGSSYVERVLEPSLELGRAERTVDAPLSLVHWVMAAVHPDAGVAADLARRSLAFYLSTASYAPHFVDTPWEAAQQAVAEAFVTQGPQWEKLGSLVPDAMLEEYCIWGDAASARARMEVVEARLRARGVEELVIQVSTMGEDARETDDAYDAALDAFAAQPRDADQTVG